ncbi:hypothetical protein LSH36_120g06032 [Paralvinella palmiformis]|uniref:Neurotransmitter-gated ion-channel ligand-binding domain-containing protein n=1 Tax=Paralvinella palmiformis TaxID=53620 RepID=A0AAD9JYS4_9ANNE|nr:hypothetical protein LSH36_120g06032 [Paralvinella palmiformis]
MANTGEKKEIFIRVVFIKIGEINTLQENFFADAFVQARWRESKLDGKGAKGEEVEFAERDKYWNPSIYVDNCIGEPKESIWHQVHYDSSGSAYIVEKRRIKGLFFEKMELKSYPFDTQIFIGILLFTTFAVDVTLVQNRLQISFILLLSNITFKFNIAQMLPKVSYLTLLDKYVILQMSMMFVVCLWHTAAFLLYSLNGDDEPLAIRYDKIAFIILIIIYFLFQLIFILYTVHLVKKRGKLFIVKEKKQTEMLNMMDQRTKKGNKRQILPKTTNDDNKMETKNEN